MITALGIRFNTIHSITLANSIRVITLDLNSANTLVVLESIMVIQLLSLDTPPDGSIPIIGGYLGTRLDLNGISSNIFN